MNALKPEVVGWLEGRFRRAGVPESEWDEGRMWARYYLDFCAKYGLPPRSLESIGPFLKKLKAKGQNAIRREAAEATVRLLLGSQEEPAASAKPAPGSARILGEENQPQLPVGGPSVVPQPSVRAGSGASWQAEFEKLTGAIRMRNYSATTLRTYRHWVAKFQAFVHSKAPADLGTEDVKDFLTDLAVRHGVAASTQPSGAR
jgi:hypothetical protein